MKKTLKVEGMSCGHCEKAVKSALRELNGVDKVEVKLAEKTVEIVGSNLEDDIIKKAIEDAGYEIIQIS